jgi:hypothetical protein
MKPNSKDLFALVGFDIPTRGSITEKGQAIFVSNEALKTGMVGSKPILEVMKSEFGTGDKGVSSACDLTSACAGTKTNQIWVELVKLAGGSKSIVPKDVTKVWDCCFKCSCPDEATRMSILTVKIGADSQEAGFRKGKKPADEALLKVWNTCTDC